MSAGRDGEARAGEAAGAPWPPVFGPTIHATTVLVGAKAVLIRGAPRAGKSTLALSLLERARNAGRFARLVSDDRTHVVAVHGRLVAVAPPAIAGLIERRGVGVEAMAHEPRAVVGLVVVLAACAGEAVGRAHPFEADIEGVRLPGLAFVGGRADPGLVEAAMAGR